MKITAGKNMPERRKAAAVEVNEIFAERLRRRPIDQLHAAKYEEALRVNSGQTSDFLKREAKLRRTRISSLADTIMEKHENETHAALLAMESDRQDALAAIRDAARPEDIDAVLLRLAPQNEGGIVS